MTFPLLTLMLSSTTGQVSATDPESTGDSSSWYHHRAAQSTNIPILVGLILEAIADTATSKAIGKQVLCEALDFSTASSPLPLFSAALVETSDPVGASL